MADSESFDSDQTRTLAVQASGGDADADQLMGTVYQELRALAGQMLFHPHGRTLQATALVHEAFLKLAGSDGAKVESKVHFRALAAVAMRHILVDDGRRKNRAKRGGDWQRVTLSDAHQLGTGDINVLELADSLEQLSKLDERAAHVVELRFFGGLTDKEIAQALDISERTVRNDWSMARAWLRCQMNSETKEESDSE
jgi:RNA polymerase sigma factor (TIGR02999 family)